MSTGQTLQTGHTWNTHDVLNQVDELTDFNLLEADPALAEALQRNGAARHIPSLSRYAQQLGERATWELAEQANRHTPELHRFDARGRIIDAVEFHPDRKSTRLNSSHSQISYAVFCLKKKKQA